MMGATRGAPYLSRLGMREAPFASTVDSRFFYADPARQQCLDLLLHLAEYSQEWLLVTAPAGMGKSTLLGEFLARAHSHLRPCRIEGAETTDGAQLFLRIAGCFGLDLARTTEGNPLEALRAHLATLQAEQVPVVVVDDAGRLGDDAVEILLHLADLQGEHGNLVRLVLFAEPGLQQRLAGERFALLSKPHVLALSPWDEAHTARYLVHRMSIAGYEGPNPFEAAVVKKLFRESEGLPGAINRAADAILRQRAVELPAARAGWTRRLLLPAASLAAVAGLAVILQDQISPLVAGESIPATPPAARAESGDRSGRPALPAEPTSLAERPLVLREGESVQIACSPLEKGQAPAPQPESAAPPVAPETPAPQAGVPQAEPAVSAATPEAPAPTAVVKPSRKVAAPGASGSPWLQAQKPGHFTLQLLAASQFATVQEFLKAHPPELPYAVIETSRDGGPLYVVVAGSYPTHAAAAAAAQGMTGLQPWPRPFRGLQSTGTPPATPVPSALKTSGWIESREPGRFTLQLAAAGREQAVLNQLGNEPLPGPTALFATERHGQPLFMALYGDYPDEAAALAAYRALPARLRQGAPLVRAFGTLQKGLPPAPQA
jgi:DamX protein